MRAPETGHGCRGSGFTRLIIASRTILRSTASIVFAASLLAVSGCTPTTGPDVATAAFGVTTGNPAAQTQLSNNADTAPDQAPAVVIGANGEGSVATPLATTDPLAAAVEQQAFVPGAVPPSAMLQTSLAAETSVNTPGGAVADSGNYVTDGVEKTIKQPAAQPAPLTPSDVAGQVPAPSVAEPQVPSKPETAKQVAALNVSEPEGANTAVADPIVAPKSARSVADKKPTLFESLFASKPKKATQSLTASPSKGDVQLASLETSNGDLSDQSESMNSLPGVNAKNLFGLDPANKNASEDSYEDEPEVQVASAAGMARLAPNGLLKQTDRVDVACFKPELVSVLKKIEGHYGQKVVVTSGYRSPQGNRRAGGSRHSLHMMCAAADIQISGVGKWELAKYLRSMPGRGGVGTYCYTDSVHIDVGSERDWNWRCRRR
jgi:uncharacterized protein YcbK (DUF882 family)